MKTMKRTAVCSRCGEVLLKIIPSSGCVVYKCKRCNATVGEASYDDYETILSTCAECDNDIFKVKVEVDEEGHSILYENPECAKCGCASEVVCVDDYCDLIDENMRKNLIQNGEIHMMRGEIEDIKKSIEYYKYDMEEKNYIIYELQDEIYSLKKYSSRLEGRISELEQEIETLKQNQI